jgi:hypothetical protein
MNNIYAGHLSMRAFAADYALSHFTTPKQQLGLTTFRFKLLVLLMHCLLLFQLHVHLD